jgi:hypothetical protein
LHANHFESWTRVKQRAWRHTAAFSKNRSQT